jgi:serine/threonine protein kinase/beta-lactam-binding protein with PASTA domain
VATSHSAELVGRVLGDRYRLTRRIGQGGSAQVYAADDTRLRRQVAVKVLHAALADEAAFLRRFEIEARVVAGLQHPHILRVYDWGEDHGDPYLVMELLEGGSLATFLDDGRSLSPSQAARIGADVAGALAYAHRRGLVHRDIKPANLLFDEEGRITVADFGLARALAESTLTEPVGSVVGTARYAAPEQVAGESLDDRADVYALALVLVEATTGEVPFARDTTLATLTRRTHEPLRAPAQLGVLVPVIEGAGKVLPEERLDAVGLARALESVATTLPPPAPLRPSGPLQRGRPDHDDHPTEIPGRSGLLFDIEAVESSPVVTHRPDTATNPPGRRGDGAPTNRGTPEPTASEPTASEPRAVEPSVFDRSHPADGSQPADRAAEHDGVDRPGRRRWVVLAAVVVVVALLAAGTGVYLGTRPTPTSPVPALHGRTVAQARAALRRLHLQLTVAGSTYAATGAAGTVLSQQPTGGRLAHGKTISVVVSKGPQPIAVPTLANKTESDAEGIITALGLTVGKVTPATSLTVPAGSVISADPAGGTLLPGRPVALVVSTGKPTVAVPTLSGADVLSFAAAQAALQGLGLTAVESDQYSTSVQAGEVIVTDPAPGATVTVGTAITVDISKGPHLVAVPDVADNSVTTASQLLASAGFSVSGVTGNPTATVTGSDPVAGTMALYGSAVQLSTS